jgi:hypothetical protein
MGRFLCTEGGKAAEDWENVLIKTFQIDLTQLRM